MSIFFGLLIVVLIRYILDLISNVNLL